MNTRPPLVAEWLLQRLLDAGSREAVAGDLAEEHARIRSARGRAAAARWYWRDACRSVVSCGVTGRRRAPERRYDFESGGGASARDLLRPALRQFRDQPVYALACVGTLALAIGAACASFAVVKRALLDPLLIRVCKCQLSLAYCSLAPL